MLSLSKHKIRLLTYSIVLTGMTFLLLQLPGNVLPSWASVFSALSLRPKYQTHHHGHIIRDLMANLSQNEMKIRKIIQTMNEQYPKAAESVDKILGIETPNIPTIYAITPTYKRIVQKAELVRLSQTFLSIRNFHWIVVEDSDRKTQMVSRLLEKSGIFYTHLNVSTSKKYRLLKKKKPAHRGVEQRNIAIEWILKNVPEDEKGVVYFADDDNVYTLQIFEEMRTTQMVSVWPVGLAGWFLYEGPVLNDAGKVSSWRAWAAVERQFATDMASFAVSLKLLRQRPNTRFNETVSNGYLETSFLAQLGIKKEDMEPLADRCSKVMVWHTRTQTPNLENERKLNETGNPSDPSIEV